MKTIYLLAQTTLKKDGFYGGDLDGVWGPISIAAADAWEAHNHPQSATAPQPLCDLPPGTLTTRTIHNISTLDPKVQDIFTAFALEANALAAREYGGIYEIISGWRTPAEQARLYAISQAGGAHAAAPWYSNHNFRLAGDGALMVRINGIWVYMDGGTPGQQATAERFHHALIAIAAKHRLKSGATWTGKSNDPPHVQYDLGHDIPTAADRAKFQATGSLL